VSLETKIDIVVKNLNQLNKLSENLKGINASNEKLVKGLEQINTKLDRIGSKGFTGLKRSADSASKSVSNLSRNVSVFDKFQKSGNNAAGRAMGLAGLGGVAVGANKAVTSYNAFIAKNALVTKSLGLVSVKATGLAGVLTGLGGLISSYPQIAGAVAIALTALGIKGFDTLGKKAFNLGAKLRELKEKNTTVFEPFKMQLPQTTKELERLNAEFGESHLHAKNLEDALRRVNSVGLKGNVLRNVGRSKASRAGSGFADFSRRADQVMNTPSGRPKGMFGPNRPGAEDAVTKSIRRHLKLEAKRTGVVRQTWDIEKKIEEAKKRSERVTVREGKTATRTAKERLANWKRIRSERGRGQENLMLGAGFPLLFGGGVGSVGGGVGGALLGNKMGMPGFGAQILGSAIGAMMDTAVQKAAKLGEALKSMSMQDLVDSGVRVSAELQTQVTALQRIGQMEQARALLASQVMNQTGASAGVLGDISNMTNILKGSWNDLVGSAGAFLGVIAGPLITALAGVLKIVTEILKLFNRGFSAIRDLFRGLGERFAPGLVDAIDRAMDSLNTGLQEAIAKSNELARKFDLTADHLFTQRTLRQQMTPGKTFEGQRTNQGLLQDADIGKMLFARREERGNLLAQNKNLQPGALKAFDDVTEEKRLDIIEKYSKEIDKINAREQEVLGKIERQNELKAAVLGIDKKIAQAKTDENKELEFRLEAEKQKASIISKSMETAANAKSEEAKILGLKQTEIELNRVNFELQTKIDEFRKEKKKEAEDVLTDLQNQNDLLQGKIDGNEEEIKQLQTIEKIVDKIGEGYREQVTTLIEKNGQLKETAENTGNVNKEWKKIKDTIASGLTDAIMGLIEGTKSLKESLAGIAKQIAAMIIQKAILSALPFSSGGVTTGSVSSLPKVVTAAQGAYFGNGIKPFSTGGMATRPTLGLIGEAGESEYIIPASKMASSMQRYSAGARGEAVIPGTGSSYAGGGAGGSTTVNYSGPILNFNSEEFVPKSAVGQIIATATSQGAKAGENRTLSTLRNSRSARSRLGM